MIFVLLFSNPDNLIKWAIYTKFFESPLNGPYSVKLLDILEVVYSQTNFQIWMFEFYQIIAAGVSGCDEFHSCLKQETKIGRTEVVRFQIWHYCMIFFFIAVVNLIWWGHQHCSFPDVLLQHRAIMLTSLF